MKKWLPWILGGVGAYFLLKPSSVFAGAKASATATAVPPTMKFELDSSTKALLAQTIVAEKADSGQVVDEIIAIYADGETGYLCVQFTLQGMTSGAPIGGGVACFPTLADLQAAHKRAMNLKF